MHKISLKAYNSINFSFIGFYIYSDTDSEHEKGIQPLRENIDFPRFLVTAILQKLNQVCK